MAGTELKIDDDIIKETGKDFENWAAELQKGIKEYYSILENITDKAIISGDTATALKDFQKYVAELEGVLENIGKEIRGLCDNFLSEIDAADDWLY